MEVNAIRKLFLDSYKELFKREEINFPPHLEHLVLPCITEDENSELCRVSTPDEIKTTLFSMSDLKAPGPDGYPIIFYKQLWPSIGDDVIKAVTSFFTIGSMPRKVNWSLIVPFLKSLILLLLIISGHKPLQRSVQNHL